MDEILLDSLFDFERLNHAVDGLLRVSPLHALLYCERLFYLEEVEEIRVAVVMACAWRMNISAAAAVEVTTRKS